MVHARGPARVLLVAAMSLLLTAPAASAHTEVVSTTPKAGAYAKRTLSTVRVRFNQPIRSGTLKVERAGEKVSTGDGRRSPGNVRAIEAKLDEELAGGTYVARWTMTASDGHTQRGSWRFKVRPEPKAEEQATPTATATGTPTASPSPSPSVQPETTVEPLNAADEGASGTVLVVGAGLVALFIVGGVVAARRRSR